MSELARGPLDELAARWYRGWAEGGFAACCTPDVSYEDPTAPQLLGAAQPAGMPITVNQSIQGVLDEAFVRRELVPALERAIQMGLFQTGRR